MTSCNPHHLWHAIRLALMLVSPFPIASSFAAEQAQVGGAANKQAAVKPIDNPKVRKTALVMLGTNDDWHMRPEQVDAFAGLLTGFCKLSAHFSSKPADFATDNIRKYDLIVLYSAFYTWDKVKKQKDGSMITALENVFKAVEAGTPLLSVHGGVYNTTIDGRPENIKPGPEVHEIERQIGAKYVYGPHYPFQEFTINIGKEHPITKGVTDFMVADEFYRLEMLDPAAEVLASYDARSVAKGDPEKPGANKTAILETVAWGSTRPKAPVLYTRIYGKGKIVVNILGHDERSLRNPSVVQLYKQSLDWLFDGK
jgi:type 1 glutamine amidotransferase